jgi:glycosyltransferase involved in cell wall biosynthesis
VEMLYLGDNKKRSIGRKRNDLLALAQGEYVVFVDDDDILSPNFVQSIYEALDGSDCIIYNVACSINKGVYKMVYYDKGYRKDRNFINHYERLPNHLMVVKREIARSVGFKDLSFGEDALYAKELKNKLHTQRKIKEILYYYNFCDNTSESGK